MALTNPYLPHNGQSQHDHSTDGTLSRHSTGQILTISPEYSLDAPPNSPETLRQWIHGYTGVKIAHGSICQGHDSIWDFFHQVYFERPSLSLVLGSRGGGKSFLSALNTHVTSRWSPKHGTRILGGSRAQSEQIYRALKELVFYGNGLVGSDHPAISRLLNEEAIYSNGSDVSILSASSTSVRGPHVASLKLNGPPDC
jgi:hypothetical protein